MTPGMNEFEFSIPRQPDDSSCGPTCLHAVYKYFGDQIPLEQVMAEVETLETGGTLAVALARHALRRGYRATIYTYNLQIFDPTWFANPDTNLPAKLREQAIAKGDEKLRFATSLYLDFLERGGQLRFEELADELIVKFLEQNQPILTGLSATYLYASARETGGAQTDYDDVRGYPVGHFVVLCGYDRTARDVLVADPLHDNPRFQSRLYRVHVERVQGAILLGALTYDGNFLILQPPSE